MIGLSFRKDRPMLFPSTRSHSFNSTDRRISYKSLLLLSLIGTLWQMPARAAESAVLVPAPAFDVPAPAGEGLQTAVLAGGCFWGVQAVFQHVKGVTRATSGYAGGSANTAEYEVVSTGETGHAESVKITYDPSQITYGELLRVFFSAAHDP